MKKIFSLIFFIAVVSLVVIIIAEKENESMDKAINTPNDWFFLQRSFPYDEINYEARKAAWDQSQKCSVIKADRGEGWVLKGPFNIGGRISAIAMHPSDMQTIYAGAASGGIFKSVNTGQTWESVFDDALSLSIGDIAIAPSNPEMIWVGTGEANAGGGSMSYDGFGIYKSEDGGSSWLQAGLENCGSTGRLAVHPQNPEICYVAAMGRLFSDNPDRGIFRTTDGGTSWQKVLFLNDSVGAIDIVIHPEHPDTLYAALWERVRRPHRRNYGGTGCGIYRSYDGGDSWAELSGGLPVNSPANGRIGIDISASDPTILYAIYADNIGYFAGVYKTTDGGNTWVRTNDGALDNMYSSYGWWFGRISIDPVDPDIVFPIGFDLYKSSNGGNSWSNVSSYVHVDQHDLVIHPMNHNFIVLGNDGGVYTSNNGGSSWNFIDKLPITQFYTCEVDEQYPYRLYGGTQDNGTNRTYTGGTDDWYGIYGGDGFHVLVDQVDNSYVYAEYQYGNFARSVNGGNNFIPAMSGISASDRKNWNTPFVFDPNNTQTLYYGANRLYKTTNRAVSWLAISPDLTNGGAGNVVYGTITTIAVAPSNSQYIYCGTDDGNLWKTDDGGGSWNYISTDLPLRWITHVATDPFNENVVYVTLSGYRYDSYLPHIFRSADGGEHWEDISGNMPEAPANDIIVDPGLDSTLYVATDFGLFVTRDLGQEWAMLGDNLPNVPLVDIDFHQPTHTLIAATYGRSMYTFNVDQLVSVNDNNNNVKNEIIIHPNPVDHTLNIDYQFNQDIVEYWIVSLNGNIADKGELNAGDNSQITVSHLLPGIFVLHINEGDKTYTAKFVKR